MSKQRWYRVENGHLIKYWEHDGAAFLRDNTTYREVVAPLAVAKIKHPDLLRKAPGYENGW